MPSFKDLNGMVFSRLTVLGLCSRGDGKVLWMCRCECGKEVSVLSTRLTTKHTTSCGCARYIKTRVRKHGKRDTLEYNSWCAMKQRCYYEKNKRYNDYGGRGIRVCERWKDSFENFYEDMGKRPSKDYTLERIDVNKDYEPSNCVWLEKSKQMVNMTTNIKVEINGETKCLKEWAKVYGGASYLAVLSRYHRGWPLDENIFVKYTHKSRLAYKRVQ